MVPADSENIDIFTRPLWDPKQVNFNYESDFKASLLNFPSGDYNDDSPDPYPMVCPSGALQPQHLLASGLASVVTSGTSVAGVPDVRCLPPGLGAPPGICRPSSHWSVLGSLPR